MVRVLRWLLLRPCVLCSRWNHCHPGCQFGDNEPPASPIPISTQQKMPDRLDALNSPFPVVPTIFCLSCVAIQLQILLQLGDTFPRSILPGIAQPIRSLQPAVQQGWREDVSAPDIGRSVVTNPLRVPQRVFRRHRCLHHLPFGGKNQNNMLRQSVPK